MLIAIIKMESKAFICSTKCLQRHHPIFHVTEIKYGLCPRHPSEGRRLKGVLQLWFSPRVIIPGCLCLLFFLKTSRRKTFSGFTSGVQGVCFPATLKVSMNPGLKFWLEHHEWQLLSQEPALQPAHFLHCFWCQVPLTHKMLSQLLEIISANIILHNTCYYPFVVLAVTKCLNIRTLRNC